MFSLSGLNCLVTGGTSGIGYAIAQRFAECGANVAILGRRATELLAARSKAKLCLATDCTQEKSVRAAFAEAHRVLGPLDVIVNNAGRLDSGQLLEDATSEQLKQVFELNAYGTFYGLKYGPKLCRSGASIINTASISGLIGMPGSGPYSASKAAVISLTQVAALELAPRGIRVNAVCPGTVITEMVPPESPEVPLVAALCPMGRPAHTDDVVGVYHFLAARESAYLTGQTLVVDGGLTAGISLGTIDAVSTLVSSGGVPRSSSVS
jgi:NAD(P)-dependent dehydrogenase (short-subunit alcohol dehydrogenase family)